MNQNNKGHSVEKLVCSIFFSLFAGVFIGMLFAPKSGAKLREDLKYFLGEVIERGKFTVEEAKVYGSEFIDKSRERVGSFSYKIKNGLVD